MFHRQRGRGLIWRSDTDVVQIFWPRLSWNFYWKEPETCLTLNCCWQQREGSPSCQCCELWFLFFFWRESQFACDWLLFFVILQTMAGEHKHRKWVKIIENYPQIHQTFSGENSLTKLKLSNDILLRQRNVDRSGNTKHQTSSMKYQQCYLFSWDPSNFLGRQFFSSKLFEKYLF